MTKNNSNTEIEKLTYMPWGELEQGFSEADLVIDKLNELIAAHNALEERIHGLEINRGGR